MNSSAVPSQAEIEEASKNVFGLKPNSEDKFFMGYNNLLFLQTEKKV